MENLPFRAASVVGGSGGGPANTLIGSGTQYNSNLTGSGNTQHIYYGQNEKPPSERCRDALFLCDPAVDRANLVTNKGERVPGTCEWITRNDNYILWQKGESGPLWISGSPGRGKTMISIYITHELEMEHTPVIFFFCDRTANDRTTATAVLRGLIWQTTHHIKELAKYLHQYFDPEVGTPRNLSTLASQETLWNIWMTLLDQSPLSTPMYCLLDGLDECDDDSKRWLAKKLTSLQSSSVLRLAVVSRPDIGLDKFARIKLDPDNNEEINGDVLQVVATGLQELSEKIPRFEEIRDDVESKILERADGTFLWIGFAMQDLLKCATTTEILRRIQELPKGLDLLYSHMLLRIKEENRTSTALILRWVTMAERPLALDEIGEILGLSAENSIARYRMLEDRVRVCEPFIRPLIFGRYSLVHMSARDYLLRGNVDNDVILESFRIKGAEAHLKLAEFCLDQIVKNGPLYNYAKQYWVDHTANASKHAEAMFECKWVVFGGPCERRDAFWKKIEKFDHGIPPPLHLACRLSLPVWAHKIISENWWRFDSRRLYTQTYQGETALFVAVREGLWTVVDSLLAQGADIDARDEDGATLLMHFALGGRYRSVDLLLSRGASIDAQDHLGRTALRAAVEFRNYHTVDLLLSRGARADIRNSSGRTVLHQAAENSDLRSVRLLLNVDSKATIDIADQNGFNALHLAASFDTVELLLERRIKIGLETKPDRDVLRRALKFSEYRLKRLCRSLNRGATNRGRNQIVFAALGEAIELGHRDVARLYLDQTEHDDVNNSGEYTVLHAAAELGHAELVRRLLEYEKETFAEGYAESILRSAAKGGNTEILRLLLEQGAKIEPNVTSGRPLIHVASE